MKKIVALCLLLLCSLTYANDHKFYVAMFMVEQNKQYKELEITSRIFIDDLEKAIKKRYDVHLNLNSKKQHPEAKKYIAGYLENKLKVSFLKTTPSTKLLDFGFENDVLIAYLKVPYGEINISSITITNNVLTEIYSDQQNIMHITVNAKKSSILFTQNNPTTTLTY